MKNVPPRKRDAAGSTLRVLRLLAEKVPGDWGVRGLAQALGMSPSSAHRILAQLERAGLVAAEPTAGRYQLGLEFYRLAWHATANVPLGHVALPVMRNLVSLCNETAMLGLYDPTRMEMMIAASVESAHPLRYVVKLHEWMPVYAGASGLAIMAFLPEEERHGIVARTGLRPLTDRTITNPRELEKVLERIRRQGYACIRGTRIPGAVGVAAPIWGPAGRVIGDLVITLPEQRFGDEAESRLARLVMEHARRLTEQLGGESPRVDGKNARSAVSPAAPRAGTPAATAWMMSWRDGRPALRVTGREGADSDRMARRRQ